MTLEEALEFFDECEEFEATGLLPVSAKLRPYARKLGRQDTVLTLAWASREVYRTIALEFVARQKGLQARGGSRGRKRKLTEDDCQDIRGMYATKNVPWSVSQIAKSFGVSTGTIHKVLNGTYEKKVGMAEEFVTTPDEQFRHQRNAQMGEAVRQHLRPGQKT